MAIRDGFSGTIGDTPLIRLGKLSAETGCEILAKAEFLNPGGSVKDRTALGIIEDAERSGRLGPGGTVVEGTAGNTGIGLAHICAARGYRCIIVIPDNQSREKFELLRQLGAEVRPVPPKPYNDPDNYQKIAGRLAATLPGAIWANQFDNTANRDVHYRTTGPEIWRDSEGRVDAFVCAVGTGGTLAGVARYLKERKPAVRIVLADPMGSSLYHSALQVDDQQCVDMLYRLLREEGLFVGGSSGINLVAAQQLARELGPGHCVVTLLCDRGGLYAGRLFNPVWLRA